ncbi:MAG: hypothetical protein Kow0069_05080 [Promethearchaeota archaeon]
MSTLLSKAPTTDLENFLASAGLAGSLPGGKLSPDRSPLDQAYLAILAKWESDPAVRKQHRDPVAYAGWLVSRDPALSDLAANAFDFVAKSDLVDAFADFCADIGISVFKASDVPGVDVDLYLTKKDPILKTEAVLVLTGREMRDVTADQLRDRLAGYAAFSDWTVFVTTPAGVLHLGLDVVIKIMKEVSAWAYVVDPVHKRILGITKGKKSKRKLDEEQEKLVQALPPRPTRAPSQLKKFSAYSFDEKTSYKPKNYRTFFVSPGLTVGAGAGAIKEGRNAEIFRALIIILQSNGISAYSLKSDLYEVDDLLVSGFLTAIDSFISEISDARSMQDINYEGFFITAAPGKLVRAVLFLSQPASDSLKERLQAFVTELEARHGGVLERVSTTGHTSELDRDAITELARDLLAI